MKQHAKIILTVTIFLITILFSAKGQTWSAVGTGLSNTSGSIRAMCEYKGELYVGGYFDSIAGMHVQSLAKWNGIAWDSVPGMTSFAGLDIVAMAVYHNELVITGDQTRKWNGTSWSILGGWINNFPYSLEVYNDELYIAGSFDHADGIPTGGIARWDGLVWDSVSGPGLSTSFGDYGSALQTFNGELYLGGNFGKVNSLTARSIAKWNGSVWDTVGSINGYSQLQSLCGYNNKMYGGGSITISNNPIQRYIVSWDSLVCDSVGLGINNAPNSMVVYNNELYAAGDFDTAGGTQTLGIARWNDVSWNSVGTGLELFLTNIDTLIFLPHDTVLSKKEHIYSMCVYNNELYVGGTFTKMGGVNTNCIAKWHIVGASVNEIINNTDFALYPNPATNQISIEFESLFQQNYLIEIRNVLGQIVYSETIKNVSGKQTKNIDLSMIESGIYFVKLQGEKENVSKKFIKQ